MNLQHTVTWNTIIFSCKHFCLHIPLTGFTHRDVLKPPVAETAWTPAPSSLSMNMKKQQTPQSVCLMLVYHATAAEKKKEAKQGIKRDRCMLVAAALSLFQSTNCSWHLRKVHLCVKASSHPQQWASLCWLHVFLFSTCPGLSRSSQHCLYCVSDSDGPFKQNVWLSACAGHNLLNDTLITL